MLSHSIGKTSTLQAWKDQQADISTNRYEIANGNATWEDAEKQIKATTGKQGKSTTVSVKSHKEADKAGGKRKAGEALEEAQREAAGLEGKKNKKGKKGR